MSYTGIFIGGIVVVLVLAFAMWLIFRGAVEAFIEPAERSEPTRLTREKSGTG